MWDRTITLVFYCSKRQLTPFSIANWVTSTRSHQTANLAGKGQKRTLLGR